MSLTFHGALSSLCVRSLRVLIAEDDFLLSQGTAGQAEHIGHTVVGSVPNGQLAVDFVKRGGVDLVLMDVNMPVRDGLSAAMAIYAEHQVPSVMLSSDTQQKTVRRALSAPVFGYVLKPIKCDQLRASIDIAHELSERLKRRSDHRAALAEAIELRKIVERAKWAVVKMCKVDETQALAMLEQRSRISGQRLRAVAEEVLSTGSAGIIRVRPQPGHVRSTRRT